MGGTIRAKRGDSLWSVASGVLPMGASDREVLEAIRLIAEATGIDRDAPLKSGQIVTIPDAVDRLVERVRTHPLVDLAPVWRRVEVEPVAEAELPEVAGVAVRRARIARFVGVANDTLHPDALTTLTVGFGALSKARFDQLAAAFGGLSAVEYRRGRAYSLVDFLPGVVQALVEHDVRLPRAQRLAGTKGWSSKFPERSKEVSFDPNAHGTAYEVLRHYQQPCPSVKLFHAEPLLMEELTHESGRFAKVTSASRLRLSRIGRQKLRPGDLVLFYEQSKWSRSSTLLHSAVHVGAGIFFEKPNTEVIGEDSPWRLATYPMLRTPVVHAVDRTARLEVLRAVAPLEAPEDAFRSGYAEQLAQLERLAGRVIGHPIVQLLEHGLDGGPGDEHLSAVVEVPLALDEDGRASVARP